MDVRCNRCGTEYELDEARVAVAGTTVKCSNCGHIFKVLPGGEVREGSGAHAASTRQPTSETRLPNVALSSMPSTNPGQATSTNASSLPSNVTTTPPATTGEWMVRKVDGQIFRFRELTTLQKWIVERKVGRDDEISRTARTWKKLGEIAELTSFFQVVEAADAAQRPITASQLPQVQLSATPTGTFSAIPMPIPASISTPPQPAFPEPEPRRDSRSFAPAPVAFTPSPLTATNPVQPLDDDPVMRWQRRRTAIVRTAVAAAAGLVGVAAIAYALNHRTPTTLPPALREQVQLALTRGDDAARKVAMSALASSTVTAAPAVRARLQAEGARALNEALRLSDEAVGTAVANAAPGVVVGTPPPPAPPAPIAADAATTAERLLAEAEAALLTLSSAGVVEPDADLARATLQLARGNNAIDAAVVDAREHARSRDEAARAAVDDEARLLLTIAEAAHVDPRQGNSAADTIAKLDRFNDVRARAAAAIVQLGAVRVARTRALASTPPTLVDNAVVEVARQRLAALPETDPRRTAGTALVLALSTLPVPPAAPAVVDPNAPATTTNTSTTTTAPPTTPPEPTKPTTTKEPTTPKEAAPVNSGGLLKQGWTAIDNGKHADAIRLFNKALSLSPSLSEAQFGLAEALRFAGRREESRAAYQRYLEMDPTGRDANIAKNAIKQLE